MAKPTKKKDEKAVDTKSAGDLIHAAARAAIGMIPLAGAPATELLNLIVTPPLEKRRSAWMQDIGERLQELEKTESLDLESLRENPEFIDTVITATRVALTTSQQEKLDALRNAVLNTAATPQQIDHSVRQMLLSRIERYTEWHLRLLVLFHDPPKWFTDRTLPQPQTTLVSTLVGTLNRAYPELQSQRSFYEQIWKDLYTDGMTGTDNFHVNMSGDGWRQSFTSDLGKRMIALIRER